MKLWEIAHSRTGDKGNISNVSLIAYDAKDYEMLKKEVTPERVKEHFKGMVHGDVVRYELPNIHALNFVMYAAASPAPSPWICTARGCLPICWIWRSEPNPRCRGSPSSRRTAPFYWGRKPPVWPVEVSRKKALASSCE